MEIFRNNRNRLKLHSRRNEEQIKFKECLLPFSSESISFRLLCKSLEEEHRSESKQVVGEWRRLHNEEIHNLYPSPILLQ